MSRTGTRSGCRGGELDQGDRVGTRSDIGDRNQVRVMGWEPGQGVGTGSRSG